MAVKVSGLERVLVEETVWVVGREGEGLVGYVQRGGGACWVCIERGRGLLGIERGRGLLGIERGSGLLGM